MSTLGTSNALPPRDYAAAALKHAMDDDYWTARMPDWSKVDVPCSRRPTGRPGPAPRGNFEGFTRAASKNKWLEAHGIEHWTHFYTDYGRALQKRFFDFFLKDKKNGWDKQPKCNCRCVTWTSSSCATRTSADQAHQVDEVLSRSGTTGLVTHPPAKGGKVSYKGFSDGSLMLPPQERDLEITGPSALKLFASSSTTDADFFVVLRIFSPD